MFRIDTELCRAIKENFMLNHTLQKGFTLVELSMVLLIISLLLGGGF